MGLAIYKPNIQGYIDKEFSSTKELHYSGTSKW